MRFAFVWLDAAEEGLSLMLWNVAVAACMESVCPISGLDQIPAAYAPHSGDWLHVIPSSNLLCYFKKWRTTHCYGLRIWPDALGHICLVWKMVMKKSIQVNMMRTNLLPEPNNFQNYMTRLNPNQCLSGSLFMGPSNIECSKKRHPLSNRFTKFTC